MIVNGVERPISEVITVFLPMIGIIVPIITGMLCVAVYGIYKNCKK